MPLQRDTQHNAWHWSQCVAWIGFDEASPRKWSIFGEWEQSGLSPNEAEKALEDAVAEFLGELKARRLEPLKLPHQPFDETELDTMLGRLENPLVHDRLLKYVTHDLRVGTELSNLATEHHHHYVVLNGLYFDRDAVLALWPTRTEVSLGNLDQVYLSEFIRFMIKISVELDISPAKRVLIVKVEDAIRKQWPTDKYGSISKARIQNMARFIRPMQDAKGGNFKSKRGP